MPASRIEICKICYNILRVSYEFKRRSIENNIKLSKYHRLLTKNAGIYSDLLVMLDDKAFFEHKQELKQKYKNNTAKLKERLRNEKGDTNGALRDNRNIQPCKTVERNEDTTVECTQIKEENFSPQKQLYVKLERLNDQFIEEVMKRTDQNKEERVIKIENLDDFLPTRNDVVFIDYAAQEANSSKSRTNSEGHSGPNITLEEIGTNSSSYQEYLDNIKDSPIDFTDENIFDDEEKMHYEKLIESLRRYKTESNNEAMKEHATILIDSIKEEVEITINLSSNEDDSILSESLERSSIESSNKEAVDVNEDLQNPMPASNNEPLSNSVETTLVTINNGAINEEELQKTLVECSNTSVSSNKRDQTENDSINSDSEKTAKESENKNTNNEDIPMEITNKNDLQKSIPVSLNIQVKNKNDSIKRDNLENTTELSANKEAIKDSVSSNNEIKVSTINNSLENTKITEKNNPINEVALILNDIKHINISSNKTSNEDASILNDSPQRSVTRSSNKKCINTDSLKISKPVSLKTKAISKKSSKRNAIKECPSILTVNLERVMTSSSNTKVINEDAPIINDNSQAALNKDASIISDSVKISIPGSSKSKPINKKSLKRKSVRDNASILSDSPQKTMPISSNVKTSNELASFLSDDIQSSSNKKAIDKHASIISANISMPGSSKSKPINKKSTKRKSVKDNASIISDTSENITASSSNNKASNEDASILSDNSQNPMPVSSNFKTTDELVSFLSDGIQRSESLSSNKKSINKNASIVKRSPKTKPDIKKTSRRKSPRGNASILSLDKHTDLSSNTVINEDLSTLNNKSNNEDSGLSDNIQKSKTITNNEDKNEEKNEETAIVQGLSPKFKATCSKNELICEDSSILNDNSQESTAVSSFIYEDISEDELCLSDRIQNSVAVSSNNEVLNKDALILHDSSMGVSSIKENAKEDTSIVTNNLQTTPVVSSNNESINEIAAILCSLHKSVPSSSDNKINEKEAKIVSDNLKENASIMLEKSTDISSKNEDASINQDNSHDTTKTEVVNKNLLSLDDKLVDSTDIFSISEIIIEDATNKSSNNGSKNDILQDPPVLPLEDSLNETTSLLDLLKKSTIVTSTREDVFTSPLFDCLENTSNRESLNKILMEDTNLKNPDRTDKIEEKSSKTSVVDFEDLIYPIALPRDVNLLKKKLIGPEGLIIEQINFLFENNEIKFVVAQLPKEEKEREQKKMIIEQFLCKQDQFVITSQCFETKTIKSNIIYKEMSPLLIEYYNDNSLSPDEKTNIFIENCLQEEVSNFNSNKNSQEPSRNSVIEIHFIPKDMIIKEAHLEEHSYTTTKSDEERLLSLEKKRKIYDNMVEQRNKKLKLDDVENIQINLKTSPSVPDLRSASLEEINPTETKLQITDIPTTETTIPQSTESLSQKMDQLMKNEQIVYPFDQLLTQTITNQLDTKPIDIEQKWRKMKLQQLNEPTNEMKNFKLKIRTQETESKPRLTQVKIKLIKPVELSTLNLINNSTKGIKKRTRRRNLFPAEKEKLLELSKNASTKIRRKIQVKEPATKSRLLKLIDQLSNALIPKPTDMQSSQKEFLLKNKRKRTQPKAIHQLRRTEILTLSSPLNNQTTQLSKKQPINNTSKEAQTAQPVMPQCSEEQVNDQKEATPLQTIQPITLPPEDKPIEASNQPQTISPIHPISEDTNIPKITMQKRSKSLQRTQPITLPSEDQNEAIIQLEKISKEEPIILPSEDQNKAVIQLETISKEQPIALPSEDQNEAISQPETISKEHPIASADNPPKINRRKRTKSLHSIKLKPSEDQLIKKASNNLQTTPMMSYSTDQEESNTIKINRRKRSKSLQRTQPISKPPEEQPKNPPKTTLAMLLKTKINVPKISRQKRAKSLNTIKPMMLSSEEQPYADTSNALKINRRKRSKSLQRTQPILLSSEEQEIADLGSVLKINRNKRSKSLQRELSKDRELMNASSSHSPNEEASLESYAININRRKRSKSVQRIVPISLPFEDQPLEIADTSNEIKINRRKRSKSLQRTVPLSPVDQPLNKTDSIDEEASIDTSNLIKLNRRKRSKSLQRQRPISLPSEEQMINELQTPPPMMSDEQEIADISNVIKINKGRRSKSLQRNRPMSVPSEDQMINEASIELPTPSPMLSDEQEIADISNVIKINKGRRSKSLQRNRPISLPSEDQMINKASIELQKPSPMLSDEQESTDISNVIKINRRRRSKSLQRSLPIPSSSEDLQNKPSIDTSNVVINRRKRSKSLQRIQPTLPPEDQSMSKDSDLQTTSEAPKIVQKRNKRKITKAATQPSEDQPTNEATSSVKKYGRKRHKPLQTTPPMTLPFEDQFMNQLQTTPLLPSSYDQASTSSCVPKRNRRKRSKSMSLFSEPINESTPIILQSIVATPNQTEEKNELQSTPPMSHYIEEPKSALTTNQTQKISPQTTQSRTLRSASKPISVTTNLTYQTDTSNSINQLASQSSQQNDLPTAQLTANNPSSLPETTEQTKQLQTTEPNISHSVSLPTSLWNEEIIKPVVLQPKNQVLNEVLSPNQPSQQIEPPSALHSLKQLLNSVQIPTQKTIKTNQQQTRLHPVDNSNKETAKQTTQTFQSEEQIGKPQIDKCESINQQRSKTIRSPTTDFKKYSQLYTLLSPKKVIKTAEDVVSDKQSTSNIVNSKLTTKNFEINEHTSNMTLDSQSKEKRKLETFELDINDTIKTDIINKLNQNIPMKKVILKLVPINPNNKEFTKILSIEPHKSNDLKTTEKPTPKVNHIALPKTVERTTGLETPENLKTNIQTKVQTVENKTVDVQTTESLITSISDSVTITPIRSNSRRKTFEDKTNDIQKIEYKPLEKPIIPDMSDIVTITTVQSNLKRKTPKINIISNQLIAPKRNDSSTSISSENNDYETNENLIIPQTSGSVITNTVEFAPKGKTQKIKLVGNKISPERSDKDRTKTGLKTFEDELIDYAKTVWGSNVIHEISGSKNLEENGNKTIEKVRKTPIKNKITEKLKYSDNTLKTALETSENKTTEHRTENLSKTNDNTTAKTCGYSTSPKSIKTFEKEIMEFESFLFGSTNKQATEELFHNKTNIPGKSDTKKRKLTNPVNIDVKTNEKLTTQEASNTTKTEIKAYKTNATSEELLEVEEEEILAKKSKYQCYKCSDQFRSATEIEYHLENNRCFFMCNQCFTGFMCYAELKLHQKSHAKIS